MIAGKPTDERLLVSEIFEGQRMRSERKDLGTLREPAQDIPVYRDATCWWSAAGLPERRRLRRPALGPRWCCWNAIIISAAFRPAAW